MRIHRYLMGVGTFLLVFQAAAQQHCIPLMEGNQERLKQDIAFLASDELRGREPGTEGIEIAAQYIQKQFEGIGLLPVDDSYRQKFSIPVNVTFGDQTAFVVDGKKYVVKEDFYPVQYSSNGSVNGETVFVQYGITDPEKKYDDYKKLKPKKLKGKVFVMDVSSPDGIHPHSAYLKYHDLGERIQLAIKKGATGVILINTEGTANDLSSEFKNIHSKGVPVVFVPGTDLAKDLKRSKEVKITCELKQQSVETSNVIGQIDNGAPLTIIIGAHYDHLGMGGESSLDASGKPAIHNGADDNASGVAGIIELARNILHNRNDFKQYNYLFIAFSGEEKGLLGSAFYTEKMHNLPETVNYMFNLDMVGRLRENSLAVNGVGTSPVWQKLVKNVECGRLKIKTSNSGVGPSDQTNFYYQKIPVLFFFTGTHMDYHKPSDDVEKINFEGEAQVLEYILNLIKETQHFEKLAFTPTKDESQMAPKFSVTLGVMPDYLYDKEGMRIDGVTEGRPADKAGMKAGDVVVQLGEVKVVDMMSYMKALGQYKKGDEAPIEFMRGGKRMKAIIKF